MLAYDSLIDEGDEALEAGDTDRARERYLRARRLRPEYPGAIHGMAKLEDALGRPHVARALLDEFLAEAPGQVDGWCGLLQLLERLGDTQRYAQVLGSALKRFPSHGDLLSRLAELHAQRADHLRAAVLFEAAATADHAPSAAGRWRAANELRLAGEVDRALALAMASVALLPLDPGAHVALALAQAANGQLGLGRRVLETARARLPSHVALERTAARLALDADDAAAALKAAVVAVRLAPADWEAWALVASAHLARGDPASSERAARRAASLTCRPEPARTLARAHRAQGRCGAAMSLLCSTVSRYPFDWEAWQDLGELLLALRPDRPCAARIAFDAARCVAPLAARWRSLAWLAVALTLEGDHQAAQRFEAHARHEAPRPDPVFDRLAALAPAR